MLKWAEEKHEEASCPISILLWAYHVAIAMAIQPCPASFGTGSPLCCSQNDCMSRRHIEIGLTPWNKRHHLHDAAASLTLTQLLTGLYSQP